MDDTTLSTGEAAKALGIAPKTMRDWCDQGKIPFWRSPGGRRRIAEKTIEDLLEERRQALSG